MLVSLFSSAYVLLRYIVIDNVAWQHFPSFLMNKIVALVAVVCLVVAALSFYKKKRELAKFWGLSSLHFAALHILFSLALMGPKMYPELYQYGETNLKGELLILFGVLASYIYWCLYRNESLRRVKIFSLLLSSFLLAHLVSLGLGSWLSLNNWLINLPSVSFLSFVIVLVSFTVYAISDE